MQLKHFLVGLIILGNGYFSKREYELLFAQNETEGKRGRAPFGGISPLWRGWAAYTGFSVQEKLSPKVNEGGMLGAAEVSFGLRDHPVGRVKATRAVLFRSARARGSGGTARFPQTLWTPLPPPAPGTPRTPRMAWVRGKALWTLYRLRNPASGRTR